MDGNSTLTLKKLWRYALQGTVLGMVAMVGVVILTAAPDTLEQLKSFPLRYLPFLFGLIACSWMLSGVRVWLLAKSLGYALPYRRALAIVLSMEFGIAASPAGMGGAVILVSLLRASGIPVAASASILAADMGVDAIFFLFFTPIALTIILRESYWSGLLVRLQGIGPGVMVAIALLLAIVLVGVVYGKWLSKIIRRVEHSSFGRRYRLAERFRHLRWKTKSNLRKSWEAVLFLYRNRRITLLVNFILAIFQWLCRYGVLPLILIAFSSDSNPLPLILIQCFLFALGLLLVFPGGGGGIEVVTPFIIQHYVTFSLVGVVLVLWRFFTYHLNLLVGGVVFFLTCRRFEQDFSKEVLSSNEPKLDLSSQH
jgi:uncharacterized protein (TIRG00374 family)